MCIPHPDTLSMGKDDVRSYICLQYIPTQAKLVLSVLKAAALLLRSELLSALLFLPFHDIGCEGSRVLK